MSVLYVCVPCVLGQKRASNILELNLRMEQVFLNAESSLQPPLPSLHEGFPAQGTSSYVLPVLAQTCRVRGTWLSEGYIFELVGLQICILFLIESLMPSVNTHSIETIHKALAWKLGLVGRFSVYRACKPDSLSSIHRTRMVEAENSSSQVVLWLSHMYQGDHHDVCVWVHASIPTHTHTTTQIGIWKCCCF